MEQLYVLAGMAVLGYLFIDLRYRYLSWRDTKRMWLAYKKHAKIRDDKWKNAMKEACEAGLGEIIMKLDEIKKKKEGETLP